MGGGSKKTTSRVSLGAREEGEVFGEGLERTAIFDIQSFIGGRGAGERAQEQAGSAQDQLAALLQQVTEGGGRFQRENIAQGQQFAEDIFAPQRQALEGRFQEEEQATAQLAGQLGRPQDDPILRAKLAQSRTRQFGELQAQQGAFAAQSAQGFQQQRLGSAGALSELRGGLASQALRNRQLLFELGRDINVRGRSAREFQAVRKGKSKERLGAIGTIGALGSAVGAGVGIASGVGAFGAAAGGLFAASGSGGGTT